MKNSIILILSILLITTFFSCSKSDPGGPSVTSYFRGTVTLNGTPVPTTKVKIELRDSSKSSMKLSVKEKAKTGK